jgi:hypothetical protein
MATKTAILAAYREQLMTCAWSSDTAKLDRFMSAAANTIGLPGEGHIDTTGHLWLRALERNGLFTRKERTLKALRALPE